MQNMNGKFKKQINMHVGEAIRRMANVRVKQFHARDNSEIAKKLKQSEDKLEYM